jgi:acyl dehydratase
MTAVTPTFQRELRVHVLLDNAPHYKGSIHDDAVARAKGYKAALIPGAFVYGHISRVAIEAWGERWAATGAMSARFRKPVYNGDDLVVGAGALVDDGSFVRSEVSVANGDGEVVATGWIALPHEPLIAPGIGRLKVLPTLDVPPAIKAGELQVGAPLHSRDRLLTEADFATSLSAFAERHPTYTDPGFVHSGMLMRMAMGDTNSSWKLPGPVVLVETETQHFATVYPGARIRISGRVVEVYERKGKHYLVSEEFLLADDTVAARFLRTQIYG